MANWGWSELFQRSLVTHGSVAYSDHLPLLLQTKGKNLVKYQCSKPFRFEVIWIGNDRCKKIIEEYWSTAMDKKPVM